MFWCECLFGNMSISFGLFVLLAKFPVSVHEWFCWMFDILMIWYYGGLFQYYVLCHNVLILHKYVDTPHVLIAEAWNYEKNDISGVVQGLGTRYQFFSCFIHVAWIQNLWLKVKWSHEPFQQQINSEGVEVIN